MKIKNIIFLGIVFVLLNTTVAYAATKWGKTETTGGTSYYHSDVRCMGGKAPENSSMQIESLWLRSGGSGTAATAVYFGGTESSPDGAELQAEVIGQAVAAGWNQFNLSSIIDWPANTTTWICWKTNANSYYHTSSGYAGDFYISHGRHDASGNGQDPSTSFNNNLGSASFSDYWYGVHLEYTINMTIGTNEPPTTPTSITCNGGSCNNTFSDSVDINCSGSTDSDGDDITYTIDVSMNKTGSCINNGSCVDCLDNSSCSDCYGASCNWQQGQELLIGTWTDTAGTFDVTPARDSWTGFPFNNEVYAESEYTQDANDIDISLLTGGHYLVLYTIRLITDYNGRLGWETRLSLDGTPVSGSYASGYTRNTANDDAVMTAGAIINASAGDDVRVEINYRTDNGDQAANPSADDCSLQIIKLDDSWDYLRLAKTANQEITTAGTDYDINWETEIEKDSGSFTHTANSDEIILKQAGHYLVVAGGAFTTTASARAAMELKTSLGGSISEYGRTFSFTRGSDDHRESNPWYVTIFEANEDDVFFIQASNEQVETSYSADTNEANMGLQIVKLPDSANYYRAHADTARDPTASSITPTQFDVIDTEDEEDAAFDGDDTDGGITINNGYEGDYLFMFTGTGTRTSTSATRSIPYLEWYKDGNSMNLGGLGWYFRGSQGSYDVFRGGSSGAVLVNGSRTSTFALYGYTLGQDPNQDRLDADEYGITAVRLNDLFGNDICLGTLNCSQYNDQGTCGSCNQCYWNETKIWTEIGNHTESSLFAWDISDYPDQSDIDLRCKAIDLDGTGNHSSYYDPVIDLIIQNIMLVEGVEITMEWIEPDKEIIFKSNEMMTNEEENKEITFLDKFLDGIWAVFT